jgi:hypothetical protein
MLNLFQHPFRRLDLSLKARWMLKQVQHDGGALCQGLALRPDFILSYSSHAMASSVQDRFAGRSFLSSACS